MEMTTITISKQTKERLLLYAKKNETWDQIINKILDALEGKIVITKAG
jgi:hypothetical protein